MDKQITIEILKEKVDYIQRELMEVRAALDTLAMPPVTTPNPLARLKFAETKVLLSIVDKAFKEIGIDVTKPAMTPEEVQQLMLQEGIKPEDNIFSRAIIESREE
jgi:hypothetical protein